MGLCFYLYCHLFSGNAINVHGFYSSKPYCMKLDTQPLNIQWVMFWYLSAMTHDVGGASGLCFDLYSHLFSGHANNVHGFYSSRSNCIKLNTQPLKIQWVMFWYPSVMLHAVEGPMGLWFYLYGHLFSGCAIIVHGFFPSRPNCMKFNTQPLEIQWVMFWYLLAMLLDVGGALCFVSISIAIYLLAMQLMSMAFTFPDRIA